MSRYSNFLANLIIYYYILSLRVIIRQLLTLSIIDIFFKISKISLKYYWRLYRQFSHVELNWLEEYSYMFVAIMSRH